MKKFLSEIGPTIIDIVIGILIGIIITAILFAKFLPRPGPTNPTHVTENPTTSQQQNKPGIQEQHSVTSTSHISITPTPAPIPGTNPKPKPASSFLSLPLGEKYTAPANITFKTKYFDLNGKQIGAGQRTITGETDVIVKNDGLDVKTSFDDSVNLAFDVPSPPPKTWHVGLDIIMVKDGLGMGGFIQKDFPFATIKSVDFSGYGRIEVDRESKLMAGIEGSF